MNYHVTISKYENLQKEIIKIQNFVYFYNSIY